MAKAPSVTKSNTQTKAKILPPGSLKLSLFDPDMDLLLRAGIGGLATTLLAIEQQDQPFFCDGISPDSDPPWVVSKDSITLTFPDPTDVASYFEPIFKFAFGLHNHLIDLQPTYVRGQRPEPQTLARLQQGLMLTFFQHGKSRTGEKEDIELNYEVDGKQARYSMRRLHGYKHQTGYNDLIEKGCLSIKATELPGTLYPGAAVRHNAYSSSTKYEATTSQVLAALFAPIGTLSFSINRGSAVLMVPEVLDLLQFAKLRPHATPQNDRQCQIGSIGDAVLGLYATLRANDAQLKLTVPSITAYLFLPTAWASQQKSRVASKQIESLDDHSLGIFQQASEYLPSRLASRTVKESVGKGKAKVTTERVEAFWTTSVVRPLIADNLAEKRPWFSGFTRLFLASDPANGKPLRDRLSFERLGLHKMVQGNVWDHDGQRALVVAVHHALRGRYGQIAKENEANRVAMQNRFRGEYDKWRLAFSGAKTADQFRFSLCDLMSRVPANKELQTNWSVVIPMLSGNDWQLARDLSLLALASYQGKEQPTPDDTSTDAP